MPMNQRRHATVLLLGDSFQTFTPMQAFQQSVHAVINSSELFLLKQLIEKAVADNNLFCTASARARAAGPAFRSPTNPGATNGYVPDAATAIRIAVAVWEPIYGEEKIAAEKPYRAKLLTNAVWKVEGSLPENTFGGIATALIDKEDGRILKVYHTK
jgi:hypothetical protein